VTPADWWPSAVRIAGHTARTHPSPALLTYDERLDAALDAVVEYVAEHGWPEADVKDVFRAACGGIDRATYERLKHVRYRRHWLEPSGAADALSEAVTDRVAVWQVAWALTPAQWETVWAVAEVMRRGGRYRDAAQMIGKNPATVSVLLSQARARARQLWVAPGDTPSHGHYARDLETTDYRNWRYQRRRASRSAA